jgi:hypothetical protein
MSAMPSLTLEPGSTIDLREGRDRRKWDFLKARDRAEARRQIQEERPLMVIGSLPCTAFCSFNEWLNYRRMDPQEVQRRRVEVETLLNFALEVYELQLKHGRS